MKAITFCCCVLLTATLLLGQTKPVADLPKPIENTLGMKFLPVKGTDVLFCIHETRYKDYAAYAADAADAPNVAATWKVRPKKASVWPLCGNCGAVPTAGKRIW